MNRKEENKRQREYYWRNHEVEVSRQRVYDLECKQRHNSQLRQRNQALKTEVLTYYGKRNLACVTCGESRLACLSIDHVNGGGEKHRRGLRQAGGLPFYSWLKRQGFPVGYQTLCMNCQFAKRVLNEES